jgi:prevent-host-death family protein
MSEVGIRALKQNASEVVAAAVAGDTVTITDRGRPVAQLSPIRRSRLESLIETGRARGPRRAIADLPPAVPGPEVSPTLTIMREEERY